MNFDSIKVEIEDFISNNDVFENYRKQTSKDEIQMCISALVIKVTTMFRKASVSENSSSPSTENLSITTSVDSAPPFPTLDEPLIEAKEVVADSNPEAILDSNLSDSVILEAVESSINSDTTNQQSNDVAVTDQLTPVDALTITEPQAEVNAPAKVVQDEVVSSPVGSNSTQVEAIVAPTPVVQKDITSAPVVAPDQVIRKFTFQLKGGKLQVGVPYDGLIEGVGSQGFVAHILDVQFPVESGLKFDEANPAHIEGYPLKGGDIDIKFSYKIRQEGDIEDRATQIESCITVFINHDPKSLWKDLPSDQSDPHWKPDLDSAIILGIEQRLVAASKRGRSHAHEAKFRDDDFKVVCDLDSGWHVIAVADGAGSASKSRLGSKIAVNTAVDSLLIKLAGVEAKNFEDLVIAWKNDEVTKDKVVKDGLYPLLGSVAFEACKAIDAEATKQGFAVKELSTTLLLTIHKKFSFGNLFATYWVGDGGVGIYLGDSTSPKLLGKVDSGEFAGQTRFLDQKVMTGEEIAARLHFEVVDDFKALVAMTDGITDPWFETDNNLESGKYWDKLWLEIEPSLSSDNPEDGLLKWLDFWSPGNHDDRTIAVLWRSGEL